MTPEPHLPEPTIWPLVLAAGVTLLTFGVLTSLVFSAVGVALVTRALVGWIGDMRHESITRAEPRTDAHASGRHST